MGREDVDIVREAFPVVTGGGTVDMGTFFEDDDTRLRVERGVAPDAEIEFETPDGGFVGDMAGPWRGAAGLRAGWEEWVAPWASFTFQGTEVIDAGGGRVLLLGDAVGRMDSGVELETHGAALYTVRNGRIVKISHYLDQEQARRAAGLA